MRRLQACFLLALICSVTNPAFGAELPFDLAETYPAKDTLACGEEPSDDARACLEGLAWEPQAFQVRCTPARNRLGDVLVRFPSPVLSGNETNDLVAMEWYVARDAERQVVSAPAVVVVHESGSGMTVGRLFARGLQVQGLHAFLIHLPSYGERRTGGKRSRVENLLTTIRQAVADVRRARDAVAALPLVDASNISLQGTSLGGFVSATAGSLDQGYQGVFLVLAGGDLYDLIQHGAREAAQIRNELSQAGITGDKLKSITEQIEPTRLAHRLNPERTWLYSGRFDTVVPMRNALALATAAKLEGEHHVTMTADHYSGIIFLPYVLPQIYQRILDFPGGGER